MNRNNFALRRSNWRPLKLSPIIIPRSVMIPVICVVLTTAPLNVVIIAFCNPHAADARYWPYKSPCTKKPKLSKSKLPSMHSATPYLRPSFNALLSIKKPLKAAPIKKLNTMKSRWMELSTPVSKLFPSWVTVPERWVIAWCWKPRRPTALTQPARRASRNAPYSTQRGSLEITINPNQILGADYNAHTELRNPLQ